MEPSWIKFFALLRIIGLVGLAGLATLWVSGCSLYNLRQEVETINDSTILVGTVIESGTAEKAPVVVLAYSKTGSDRNIAHYTELHEPGPYELIVPEGEYFIFAFIDTNRDLIYQDGEPSGQYSSQGLSVGRSSGVIINLNIVLKKQGDAIIDFPAGTAVAQNRPEKLHSTSPGAIAALDDPLFDSDNGVKGYWQPLEFFRETGGNVYFLQPFDSSKVPVLFVHGATGSPRGWKYLVSNIDLNRYQPWFYYYPSGASLKSLADLLFWKIFNLQTKYQFKELDIVAHSMGGLVARSFLVDYGQQFPSIKKFISISTPWSGDRLSEMGVKYSPGVIPAWKDLGLQSEFVQAIYRKPLPKNLDFYLLFGHEGNRNPLRSNNDGVVTLESQLDPRVQAEAKMIYGFKEDHSSILTSKQVASLINTILAPNKKTKFDGTANSEGMLKVRYSSASNRDDKINWSQLYLLPTDQDSQGPADGIFISIGNDGNSREFGPLPAGNYYVSLLSESYRAEPVRVAVAIKPNETATATFELKPDGAVVDYIRRTFYKDEDPAGTYVLPAEDIAIRSIRLTGEGVDRIVIPSMGKAVDSVEYALDRRDWATKTVFAFYNLPEGNYRLILEADGYERKTVQKQVIPGRLNVNYGIVMTPLKSGDKR
jgi:uncharacterized alpha/beta hydrolase family protein